MVIFGVVTQVLPAAVPSALQGPTGDETELEIPELTGELVADPTTTELLEEIEAGSE